mmetsp:Transcript_87346/g.154860  ORF Transcript_87346/g.154860 Transcript_87346/m.154860 type:complete len:213 (-) Transcript_87346:657-1295(-)
MQQHSFNAEIVCLALYVASAVKSSFCLQGAIATVRSRDIEEHIVDFMGLAGRIARIDCRSRAQKEPSEVCQMISQVVSHFSICNSHLDAQPLQLERISDAREHQQFRCPKRTRRQDHGMPCKGLQWSSSAVAEELHANGFSAIEEHSTDLRVCENCNSRLRTLSDKVKERSASPAIPPDVAAIHFPAGSLKGRSTFTHFCPARVETCFCTSP